MVKQQGLEIDGEIVEVLPAGNYRVRPEGMDILILCKKSGKMNQNRISLIEWDKVKIEINQYDMKFGRIIYRHSAGGKPMVNPNTPNTIN